MLKLMMTSWYVLDACLSQYVSHCRCDKLEVHGQKHSVRSTDHQQGIDTFSYYEILWNWSMNFQALRIVLPGQWETCWQEKHRIMQETSDSLKTLYFVVHTLPPHRDNSQIGISRSHSMSMCSWSPHTGWYLSILHLHLKKNNRRGQFKKQFKDNSKNSNSTCHTVKYQSIDLFRWQMFRYRKSVMVKGQFEDICTFSPHKF